jgi:acyl-CoA synthetase (AMP-forming)/AMP-acid ligase II
LDTELTHHAPTLPAMIRYIAERWGDRDMIALGDRRLTYRQAERESAHLARGLLAAGAGKGTRVALLMPNGPDWVLAWLATARIGALFVPFTTFLQGRELRWNLGHADIHTLLTVDRYLNHDYLARLEEVVPELVGQKAGALLLPSLPYLRSVRVWGDHGDRAWAEDGPDGLKALADATPLIDEDFLREVENSITPADLMLLMYTSGSTAEPKGALHTHGTAVRHSWALHKYRHGTPEDHSYTPMPFFWVGGFNNNLMSSMHSGACLFCEESFDVDRIIDLIERERTTIVAVWPHHAKAIAEHPRFPSGGFDFIRYGGWATLPDATRPPDPGLLPNALGMTETFANHSMEESGVFLTKERSGSFSRVMPRIERRIADLETGEEVAPGDWGELQIRGYTRMQGLYKIEREDVFTPDGFYPTGDHCRVDEDGYLFFKGRLGEMIKTAGANVAPREVELVLESFEEIKEAYVVGIEDLGRGQTVVAAVVPFAGYSPDPEELRERLRKELSVFKVPRHIFVCDVDEIPRTASAKILKPQLTSMLADRIQAGA